MNAPLDKKVVIYAGDHFGGARWYAEANEAVKARRKRRLLESAGAWDALQEAAKLFGCAVEEVGFKERG